MSIQVAAARAYNRPQSTHNTHRFRKSKITAIGFYRRSTWPGGFQPPPDTVAEGWGVKRPKWASRLASVQAATGTMPDGEAITLMPSVAVRQPPLTTLAVPFDIFG